MCFASPGRVTADLARCSRYVYAVRTYVPFERFNCVVSIEVAFAIVVAATCMCDMLARLREDWFMFGCICIQGSIALQQKQPQRRAIDSLRSHRSYKWAEMNQHRRGSKYVQCPAASCKVQESECPLRMQCVTNLKASYSSTNHS